MGTFRIGRPIPQNNAKTVRGSTPPGDATDFGRGVDFAMDTCIRVAIVIVVVINAVIVVLITDGLAAGNAETH